MSVSYVSNTVPTVTQQPLIDPAVQSGVKFLVSSENMTTDKCKALSARNISSFTDPERLHPFDMSGFIKILSSSEEEYQQNCFLAMEASDGNEDAAYQLALKFDSVLLDSRIEHSKPAYLMTQLALMLVANFRGSQDSTNWLKNKANSPEVQNQIPYRLKHQELLGTAYRALSVTDRKDAELVNQLKGFVSHGLKLPNIGHSYTCGLLLSYQAYLNQPSDPDIRYILKLALRKPFKVSEENILTLYERVTIREAINNNINPTVVHKNPECISQAFDGTNPYTPDIIKNAKKNTGLVSESNLERTLQGIYEQAVETSSILSGSNSSVLNRDSNHQGYNNSVNYLKEKNNSMQLLALEQHFTKTYHQAQMKINSTNVFTVIPGKTNDVVVVGAHLDSVHMGPGINDNASGVAALLEACRIITESGLIPTKTLLFSFWGAEEYGCMGSRAFMQKGNPPIFFEQLKSQLESKNIKLSDSSDFRIGSYINLDMNASPNGYNFITDHKLEDDRTNISGDRQKIAAPDTSSQLEKYFLEYFDEEQLETKRMPLLDHSDHVAFANKNVPVVMLSTGVSEKILTGKSQADGSRGEVYDPCYHQACDDLSNINLSLLVSHTKALVYVLSRVIMSDDIFTSSRIVPPRSLDPICMRKGMYNFMNSSFDHQQKSAFVSKRERRYIEREESLRDQLPQWMRV